MPEILVVDVSALCKLVRNEVGADVVQSKLRSHLEKGGAVWTHSIAATEIVTCARKALDDGEGTLEELTQAIRDALAVTTLIQPDHRGEHFTSRLLELAHETGLTGPDASYVEIALGHRLLTFDVKQAHAAKKQGIRLA